MSERQSATEERIKFLEQLDKVHPSQKSSDYVNAEEIRLKVDNDNESDKINNNTLIADSGA